MPTPQRFTLLLIFSCLTFGFTSQALAQGLDDPPTVVYLTTRLFLATGKGEISDQLFRLRTAAQTDDEKFTGNLKKAYPGYEISLLQTHYLRSFRTPKPAIITLGDPLQKHLELHFLTAYSVGDGTTPGTSLIIDVNQYAGNKASNPIPTSFGNQGFEAEAGMTYFFLKNEMKMNQDTYTNYLRGSNFALSFSASDRYLILAVAVEPDKPVGLTFDASKSADLQASATKKVEPAWVEDIQQKKITGKIQVRIEIEANGKVTKTNILGSTLPEGNMQALAAARQWEFPASALAEQKEPISALLIFSVAPPSPNRPQTEPPQTTAKPAPAAVKPKTPLTKKTAVRKAK